MPTGNGDSNSNSNPKHNKLERPPLKRPKTLIIPNNASSSIINGPFDLRVSSFENGCSASNGIFQDEQWKYPSFLCTKTRRRRVSVKNSKTQKLDFGISVGSGLDGEQNKVGKKSSVVPPSSSPAAAIVPSSSSSSSLSSSLRLALLASTAGTKRKSDIPVACTGYANGFVRMERYLRWPSSSPSSTGEIVFQLLPFCTKGFAACFWAGSRKFRGHFVIGSV